MELTARQPLLRILVSVVVGATCLTRFVPPAAADTSGQPMRPIDPARLSPSQIMPTPTPSSQQQPPARDDPKPPTIQYIQYPDHVANTGDPNVCANHGGQNATLAGVLCGTALEQGLTVLVWDWASPDRIVNPAHPERHYNVIKDIDGFNAYENDSAFNHKRVSSTTFGADSTVTMFALPDVPHGAPVQRCFVVRAFKGQLESDDSAALCVNPIQLPVLKTMSLKPAAFRTIRHTHDSPLNLPSCPVGVGAVVGFVHCNNGLDQSQEVWRSLVKFDLSDVGPVYQATLKFQRDSTYLMGTDPNDNNNQSSAPADEPLHGRPDASCAAMLLQPTYDWVTNGWDDSDPAAAPPVTDLPTQDVQSLPPFNADFAIDVTAIVRNSRLYPGTNDGFALRGADEFTSEENNDACMSTYSNFVLEVTALPSSNGLSGPLIDPGTIGQPASN